MKNYLVLSLASLLLTSCLIALNEEDESNQLALSKLVKRVDLNQQKVKQAIDYIINNNNYVWDIWKLEAYK